MKINDLYEICFTQIIADVNSEVCISL